MKADTIKPSKNHTKTFEELDFAEQAKSISAKILALGKAIKAHERRALDENRDARASLLNNISQVSRLIDRLNK